MKAGMSAAGVEFDAGVSGDRYQGRADALIAAAIITAEQLPYAATSITYFEGVRVDGRKVKAARDERWMQVKRWGTHQFCVTKGITRDERARREKESHGEAEEVARNTPMKDPGLDAVKKLDESASAAFAEGDEVFADGEAATVTGRYMLRRVRSKDGEFADGQCLVNYRPGYTCRVHESGEEFFYPAHEIRAKDGAHAHLRLVGGSRRTTGIRFSIRSLA